MTYENRISSLVTSFIFLKHCFIYLNDRIREKEKKKEDEEEEWREGEREREKEIGL